MHVNQPCRKVRGEGVCHDFFECDLPIDAATTQLIVFGIMLQDADLVAKEMRSFSPRMGNQGLCVG
jgi:hypothetical protein